MSRSYTPGLKILAQTKIIKKRQLPMKGTVHLKIGDIVKPDEVVASTEIPGNVQMVNVANQLNVEPENVPECMLVELDESISKGQIIAESKGIFGLFKSQLKSPIDGTLANVSEITGQAILSEPPIPVAVDAYTSGKITEIEDQEGVTIETEGVLVQGILGIGGENRGILEVVTTSPNDELIAEMIQEKHKGKVIVGGSFLRMDTFEHAKKIGVAGIVSGGFDYTDLSKILGYSLGVAITGSEKIGPSLIITEGFGKIGMAERTYELLSANAGKFAAINGSTQIRAGVIRPEIIIPSERENGEIRDYEEADLAITEGSLIRVIRAPYFGRVGKVKSLPPELAKMESETMVRVAEIEFEDGTIEIIPRANLEMILT
jgi:transcription antitermination factor NusG